MKTTISVDDILSFNSCSKNPEAKMRKVWSDMGKEENAPLVDVFKYPIDYPDFFWLILRSDFISEEGLKTKGYSELMLTNESASRLKHPAAAYVFSAVHAAQHANPGNSASMDVAGFRIKNFILEVVKKEQGVK